MLSKQAKKDFEKWLSNDFEPNEQSISVDCSYEGEIEVYASENFESLPFSMQYGVLVDWFDSVGVNITIDYDFNEGIKYYGFYIFANYGKQSFSTRPQAREKAIEKANEIYNKRI